MSEEIASSDPWVSARARPAFGAGTRSSASTAAKGRARQRRLQKLEEEHRRLDEVLRHAKAKGSLPDGGKATEDHSLEKVLLELEKEKLRVAELSAFLEQSQRENEEKEKRLKTLKDTLELQALREKLYAKDNTIKMLQDKGRQQVEECKRLQQTLEQLEDECRSSRRQQHPQALTDAHRTLNDFAALGEKHLLLQRELLIVREALEKLLLQRNQLMKDKHELIVALKKVYQQQDSARLDLEQLLQDSSGQVHALAGMSSEKELLVHKVAALEVQLAASEKDRQVLSEQLTGQMFSPSLDRKWKNLEKKPTKPTPSKENTVF